MAQLQGVRVILRDKQIEDSELDYRWRSDPELAKLDAAYPLTMNYDRYVKMFEDQLKYPSPGSHHYGIEVAGSKLIGNCMYYDLDSVNKEAELGIVIGDREYWSGSYGFDAVVTLLEHMFVVRDLKRVYLHTLEWNDRAQSCFSRCGFNPVRNVRRMGHDFILMEVLRTDWQQNARQLLDDRWRYLREKGGEEVLPETTGSSPF
ncbi:MAG: GNAT family N-acetyltransferase [Chloroflexota bacterium]|nr:GNAT family N-acetyltransferase [Chloroflexota bacterium]